jgi:hypothetical protein
MPINKKIPVTELDFDQIKSGLKDYLKGQEQFKDYNFEGSNMNVLLDILSYNTFQNNFYTNMAISEMFLDSAQLRESIVSHAKELNYLPRSKTSARAVIDIVLNTFGNPPFVTIPEKTKFAAICGNKTYTFFNERSATVFPRNGQYILQGLEIFEGEYVTEFFEPTLSPTNRYIISNSDIDVNSIRVRIIQNDQAEEFLYAPDLYNLDKESKVFFLQPHVGDRYELFFGRNVFGVEPEVGALIEVNYRVTNGTEGNGITSYEFKGEINGFQANIVLRTPSRGGSEREELREIKYFAPKSIQIQERAITESDFEILLKRRFPEIRNASIFGGENSVPPQYGRVIVSVDLQGFDGITIDARERYRQYLKERCSLSIEPVIVPANYMYYDIETTVTYNVRNTNKSASDILKLVNDTILDFSEENLEDFRKSLRTTKLTAAIDNSDESIISNMTQVRGIIEISPAFGTRENFTLRFANRLLAHPPRTNPGLQEGSVNIPVAVISSTFIFGNRVAFLRDNGRGVLQIITRDENRVDILLGDVGSVNYQTGDVKINGLRVDSYVGNSIKVFATAISRDFNAPVDRITSIRGDDIRINVIGTRE